MDGTEISQLPTPSPTPKGRNAALAFSGSTAEPTFDFVELLSVLRRRKNVICACVALITVIGAAMIFQITPRYTAEASVLLDARKIDVVDVQAVLSNLPPDLAVVRGEIEVMKSPQIAAKVVNTLNLTSVPEFNSKLQQPSLFSPILQAEHWLFGLVRPALGIEQNIAPAIPEDPQVALERSATYALLGHVNVTNDGRSYVLKVAVDSENPQLAANIANAYANAYLDAQLEAKFDAVKRANDWLNAHLTDLQAQVEASEGAVELYRAQHGLTQTDTNGDTLTSQQLGELNSQLILASADTAQKQANLSQIQDKLRSGGITGAEQVLSDPIIQSLRQQEADLIQQEAQLAAKYKPEHPAMINIKAQINDAEQKIRDEVNKAVQAMAGDVVAARAKEQSLRDSLQALQKTSATQDQAAIQLHELQRQADSVKTLYDDFLNRFKQTSAQEDIQQPDARLIVDARPPSTPSYPRTGLLISLVFLGSILTGLIAALGMERLDNGFRTGEQVERLAGIAPLGLVPDIRSNEKPTDAIIAHPVSAYSEAIRTVRTALRYSDVDNPPKVVLVTSALPDEGKSVFSLSLARSVAFSGGRALLIDCDLRRPSVAKTLGLVPKAGLLSVFDSGFDAREAIMVDETSGLHVITATSGTANPQDILGSRQMRALIDKMRAQYDFVVLDTPPVLAVSDAFILSHVADTTMFLVRWGRTARPVVLGALKAFRQNGGHLAGIVLSRVDFRRHASYGYGDSGYYYGYYGKHYRTYEAAYSSETTTSSKN